MSSQGEQQLPTISTTNSTPVTHQQSFSQGGAPVPQQGAWFASPQLETQNPHQQIDLHSPIPTYAYNFNGRGQRLQRPDCPECKVGVQTLEIDLLTWILLIGTILILPLILLYFTGKKRCNNTNCRALYKMNGKRIVEISKE